MQRNDYSRLEGVAAMTLALVAIVVIWDACMYVFDVRYIVASPWEVCVAAVRIRWELLRCIWLTGCCAICGFIGSVVVGSLLAIIFSQFRWAHLGCFPYAVVFQTIPIVAIAPIVVNAFESGFQSVIVIAFIISLFPIIANVTDGLMSVDPQLHELFRLNRATRWQIITKLQVPNAIPSLVTGARTSAGLAVIGAIVGDLFVGTGGDDSSFGFLIQQRLTSFKTAEAFALAGTATVLGIAIFLGIGVVRNTILARWCQRGT